MPSLDIDYESVERQTIGFIALALVLELRKMFPSIDSKHFAYFEARIRLGEDIGWRWCETGQVNHNISIPQRGKVCRKCAISFMEYFGLITPNEAYQLWRFEW